MPNIFVLHPSHFTNPCILLITICCLYAFHFHPLLLFPPSITLFLPPCPALSSISSTTNPFVPVSSFSDTSFRANLCLCLSWIVPVTFFRPCLPVDNCSYSNLFVSFSCCAQMYRSAFPVQQSCRIWTTCQMSTGTLCSANSFHQALFPM